MTKLRLPDEEGGRRSLPHDPPHFIGTSDAVFFITICCKPRGENQLCQSDVAETIFNAARHYHDLHYWSIPLLLLMPDHLHMLTCFGTEMGMADVVRNWKRYLAKHASIGWQRDFFDHRLRAEESFSDKAAYILQNPVRRGLVTKIEDWPYHGSIV